MDVERKSRLLIQFLQDFALAGILFFHFACVGWEFNFFFFLHPVNKYTGC